MTRPIPTRPKILERDLQRQIVRLFALAGCVVYDTSQGYRPQPGGTRMTPGLPDLLVFLPVVDGTGIGFFEVKTPDGLALHRRGLARGEKRAMHQALFQKRCRERGIPHGLGGMEEAYQFLASVGLATRTDLIPTNGTTKGDTVRDWHSENITFRMTGLAAATAQWRLTPRPR